MGWKSDHCAAHPQPEAFSGAGAVGSGTRV